MAAFSPFGLIQAVQTEVMAAAETVMTTILAAAIPAAAAQATVGK